MSTTPPNHALDYALDYMDYDYDFLRDCKKKHSLFGR